MTPESGPRTAGGGPAALVTGGTGFVGSHVVDALLSAGYRVRCLVRPTSRLEWLQGKPVERVEGDLREGGLVDAVADVEFVFHFAGLTRGSSEQLWAANHAGTLALLDAARAAGVRRFVYCSSQAAAGPSSPGRPRTEEDPAEPTSEYGRSKLAAERAVREEAELERVVLRPAAVYGPRDADTLPYFQMAARGIVAVPGLRDRELQVVHAADVALAARLAVEEPAAAGRTYFVADPEIRGWGDLARGIEAAVGRRALTLRVPTPLLLGLGALCEWIGVADRPGRLDRRRARDLSRRAWTCRVDRIRDELGWSPAYDLRTGLAETAAWYRAEGWL